MSSTRSILYSVLKAERVLHQISLPGCHSWDYFLRKGMHPSDLAASLNSLTSQGLHCETGAIHSDLSSNSIPVQQAHLTSSFLSSVKSDGAVMSSGEVLHLGGMLSPEGYSLPEDVLVNVVEGYFERGHYAEALKVYIEIMRNGSTSAKAHAKARLLMKRRDKAASGVAAKDALWKGDDSVCTAEHPHEESSKSQLLFFRVVLDALLDPRSVMDDFERKIYYSILLELLQSPVSGSQGGMAREVWEHLRHTIQASVLLSTDIFPKILNCAVLENDPETYLSMLGTAYRAGTSRASGNSIPSLSERQLFSCASQLGRLSRWNEVLDIVLLITLQTPNRSRAPFEPLFSTAFSANLPQSSILEIQGTPLWNFLLAESQEKMKKEEGSIQSGPFTAPPLSLHQELSLSSVPLANLALRALHHIGRHGDVVELWRSGLKFKILQSLSSLPSTPGFVQKAIHNDLSSSNVFVGGCLPSVILSHCALDKGADIAPVVEALLQGRFPIPLFPSLAGACADWIVNMAPTQDSPPESILNKLLMCYPPLETSSAPKDGGNSNSSASPGSPPVTSLRVIVGLLKAALNVLSPPTSFQMQQAYKDVTEDTNSSDRNLVPVPVSTLPAGGAWLDMESEGFTSLDLSYRVQLQSESMSSSGVSSDDGGVSIGDLKMKNEGATLMSPILSQNFASFSRLLHEMHSRGFELPKEAPHICAMYALQQQDVPLSTGSASPPASIPSLQTVVRKWMLQRPLHASISLLASSLAVFSGVSQCLASIPAPPHLNDDMTLKAIETSAYHSLLYTSSALADAVVATLGPGNSQPLTPLELSLRLVSRDVFEAAKGSGDLFFHFPPDHHSTHSPLLHALFTSCIKPLSRTPLSYFVCHGEASISPTPLIDLAANILQILHTAPSEQLKWWSSGDIGAFFVNAHRHILARDFEAPARGGESDISQGLHQTTPSFPMSPAISSIPRAVHSLLTLSSRSWGQSRGEENVSPLSISPTALSSLASFVILNDAPVTLVRALSAFSSEDCPSFGGTSSSRIHVPMVFSTAALLSNANIHLIDSARNALSKGVDGLSASEKQALEYTMGYWLRDCGGVPWVRAKPGFGIPWTLFLANKDSPSGAAFRSEVSLDDDTGAVTRPLPPVKYPDDDHRKAWEVMAREECGGGGGDWAADGLFFQDEQQPLTASLPTTVFGDKLVELSAEPSSPTTTSRPSPLHALSPRIVHHLDMLLSGASKQEGPLLYLLSRELFRLGAWLPPSSVNIISRAALEHPELLRPLLAHLRVQAVAMLQVLPGANQSIVNTLLPFVPITGTGLSDEACQQLTHAAVVAGDLTLALQLLETGVKLPQSSRPILLSLALQRGENVLYDRLFYRFGSATTGANAYLGSPSASYGNLGAAIERLDSSLPAIPSYAFYEDANKENYTNLLIAAATQQAAHFIGR